MSFFTRTIFSDALHVNSCVGVILPQDSRCHRYPGVIMRVSCMRGLSRAKGPGPSSCSTAFRITIRCGNTGPPLRYAEKYAGMGCLSTTEQVLYKHGDIIHLEFNSEKIHLFDPESGKTIT